MCLIVQIYIAIVQISMFDCTNIYSDCTNIYMYVQLCICICIYMYMCTIHMYIYTYTYIYSTCSWIRARVAWARLSALARSQSDYPALYWHGGCLGMDCCFFGGREGGGPWDRLSFDKKTLTCQWVNTVSIVDKSPTKRDLLQNRSDGSLTINWAFLVIFSSWELCPNSKQGRGR